MDHPNPAQQAAVPAVVPSLSAGPFEILVGRVLVVEDDPLNQHLIRRMLEKHGLKITVVDTGEAAVEAALKEKWDAILMDCLLPGMDGFDATRAIRTQLEGRPLPIIALTANVMPEDRAECLASGMDDFLPKPVKRADLYACLKKWLPPTRG
jgi:CheY-like chemotaxis protein